MSKVVNVEVTLDEVRGNPEKLIRRFMKKVKNEGVIDKYLKRQYYEKPSVRRRREKLQKQKNMKKAMKDKNKKLDIK